jgi:hypothetical protein|nr:MAG TPA: hypothetical protein [Caudoviricetes sp.]
MYILSDDSKKLINACSLFVKPKKDKTDLNKITSYMVLGSIANGVSVKIKEFDTEEKAQAFIEQVAVDISANKRAKE